MKPFIVVVNAALLPSGGREMYSFLKPELELV